MIEIKEMGLNVVSEYPADVYYKEHQVGAYYVDLFVENCLIIEIKAIENLLPIHEAQFG